MTDFISITFSASHPNEAKTIGMAIVRDRLAACANFYSNIEAFYWWQGHIEETTEAICVLKTRKDLFDAVRMRIRELHSYTNPMIIATPLIEIDSEYGAWITTETTQQAS